VYGGAAEAEAEAEAEAAPPPRKRTYSSLPPPSPLGGSRSPGADSVPAEVRDARDTLATADKLAHPCCQQSVVPRPPQDLAEALLRVRQLDAALQSQIRVALAMGGGSAAAAARPEGEKKLTPT